MQEYNVSKFNLQECLKCNICSEVCPMMKANPLYPGPKQAGPDGERYRIKDEDIFDRNIKFCLNCKRCEVACPSGVKIGDMIAVAKIRHRGGEHRLRDRMLASTDMVGGLATPVAPIVNGVLSWKLSKSILEGVMGVSSHAAMPKYSSQKFSTWYARGNAAKQKKYSRFVEYFHGCYVNYNCPQLGKDFVTLMNACGYGVRLLKGQKCCGVAMIANGFEKEAVKAAQTNVQCIMNASAPVLTTSSSCTLTLTEEYSNVLGIATGDTASKVQLAVKWLYDSIDRGEVKIAWRKDFAMKAVYHTPCHMQRLGQQIYSIELLRMIPGLQLDVLEQKCCGISGTFGFKKEGYELSRKIGEELFEDIRNHAPEAVITDCETCKWQIEAATGYSVYNPISILAKAIDIKETTLLNENR